MITLAGAHQSAWQCACQRQQTILLPEFEPGLSDDSGMEPAEATAWITAALAALTAGYVYFTWRLSKSSDSAARASADAASQSALAAQAAARQVDVAVAQLPIDFVCTRVIPAQGKTVFLVRSLTANVLVKSIDLHVLGVSSEHGGFGQLESATISHSNGPILVHAGDDFVAALAYELQPGTPVVGSLEVEYQLGPDSEAMRRIVSFSGQVDAGFGSA